MIGYFKLIMRRACWKNIFGWLALEGFGLQGHPQATAAAEPWCTTCEKRRRSVLASPKIMVGHSFAASSGHWAGASGSAGLLRTTGRDDSGFGDRHGIWNWSSLLLDDDASATLFKGD